MPNTPGWELRRDSSTYWGGRRRGTNPARRRGPRVGILFAVLGAGAGIANLIPGGGQVASVFDLLNPTKVTTCMARWSFNNAGDPTGGKNLAKIGKTVKIAAKGAKSLYDGGPDSDAADASDAGDAADDITLGGVLGAAGGVAGFDYGLYSAGMHRASKPACVRSPPGTARSCRAATSAKRSHRSRDAGRPSSSGTSGNSDFSAAARFDLTATECCFPSPRL
jgi:hypothetical protein